MVTAAAGPIALAEEYLASQLSNSSNFRSFVSAPDPPGALLDIYFDALPPPGSDADEYTKSELEALRPYAIIYTSAENGWQGARDSVSASVNYTAGGRLMIQIVRAVTAGEAADLQELMRLFKNEIGQIMADVFDLAGGAGFLDIDFIELTEGPWRQDPDYVDDEGDCVGADFQVTYRQPNA